MDKLPIYYISIEEAVDGIEKMSLVEHPAVERDFLKFKTSSEEVCFSVADPDKHIVFGVAILADTPIYRRKGDFEFYTVFTKEIIEELVEKFFKEDRIKDVNLEHFKDIEGATLIESIITRPGVSIDAFKDVPEGSWIVGYKIDNPVLWEDIKQGKYKGFSIEGLFSFLDEKEEEKKKKSPLTTLLEDLTK